MVIFRTRNKITDFLMILAWASPFKVLSLPNINHQSKTGQPPVAEMHDVDTSTRGFLAVQSTEVDVEKISQETSFIPSS